MRQGIGNRLGFGLIGMGLLAACQPETGNSGANEVSEASSNDIANETYMTENAISDLENATDIVDPTAQSDPMNDQEIQDRPR